MANNFLGGIAGGAGITIVIKAVDDYSKELKNVNSSLSKTQKNMKLAAGAVAAASIALGAFAVSSAKAALASLPIEQGFKSLAKGSTKFLITLNKATKGTVSNFQLMASANKALLLGLDQDSLPDLFKNAAIVGRAAGRTVTEAVEDITLGIGRQSKLILDNLGIIVKAEEANKAYAESIGKVASELTDSEKKIAFETAAIESLNAKAAELGGILQDDVLTNIQQLQKGFEDFRVAFGEGILQGISPLLKTMSSDFEKSGKKIGSFFGDILFFTIQGFRIFAASLVSITDLLAFAWNGLVDLVETNINNILKIINVFINAWNTVDRVIGSGRKQLKELSVDFSRALIDRTNIAAKADEMFANITKAAREYNKQKELIVEAEETQNTKLKEQKNLLSALNQDQRALLESSKEFKVLAFRDPKTGITSFGDVFNPRAFSSGEFQSRFAYTQATGGGGVVVNIENIQGLDPIEIANALNEILKNKINI